MANVLSHLRDFLNDHTKDEDQEDEDDLSDSTEALLSLIPAATVVVDGDDEVIRSSPDAYRLGIVSNDEICDQRIMEAIGQVRASGGRRTLTLTTETPTAYALNMAHSQSVDQDVRDTDETDDPVRADEEAISDGLDRADGGDGEGITPRAVSRTNWLKITLGRVDESLIVILIDDVSESVRFMQTREAFITNVSQQMLKPIQALEELASQLKATSELKGDDPDLLRSHLGSVSQDAFLVQRYSAYLGHLLNDLLLLIRAQERIRPSKENTLDVAQQIREVVADETSGADQAGVKLQWRCDQPLMIHGDGQQIRVALAKLVENAISYSPGGATVSLVAQPSQDGRFAVIRVIDRGRGISKSDQSRIFERFYRADNQNDQTAIGIGLGLSIVKHVALTHHGSVTVWSAPRQGSTFSLILPLADQQEHGLDGGDGDLATGQADGNPNG